MKCFIHNQEEAIAACRKCGKGMCANCSAYSNHSGICPECRKKEFINKRDELYLELSEEKSSKKWFIVKSVLLCWTIIYPLYGLYQISQSKKEIERLNDKIDKLSAEIEKLDKALQVGNAII